MALHEFGDVTTEVRAIDNWYFFYREYGVQVSIYRWEQTRPWWAFGASVRTRVPVATTVSCSVELRGLDARLSGSKRCDSCAELRVIAAWYTGLNVPSGYNAGAYQGTARINGADRDFAGDVVY